MRTICIYHSVDLDGWMSAAIVKKWFLRNNYGDVEVVDYTDGEDIPSSDLSASLTMLGYNYGDAIPFLDNYDQIIMCDVSFPKEDMLVINKRFGEKFVWIDHHQRTVDEVNDYIVKNGIPMNGSVTEVGEKKAACELTWEFFFENKEMPEIVRLLGRYDCWGFKGTEEEDLILKFQYGARHYIHNYQEAYISLCSEDTDKILESGNVLYAYLKNQAETLYSKGFEIRFSDPNILGYPEFGGEGYKFTCINYGGMNAKAFNLDEGDYDGFASFFYEPNKGWVFSLRSDKVDCSAIAKSFGGGGHKGAAGFVVDDLSKVFNP